MSIEVLDPGPLSTLQDLGRVGWAHLGVPAGGALDRGAAALARRLVGGDPDDAVVETTLGGIVLRTRRAVTLAVTGAPCDVRVGGHGVGHGAPVTVPADAVVTVGPAPRRGALLRRVRRWHRRRAGPRLAVDRHPGLGRARRAWLPARCWPSGRRAAGRSRPRRSSYDPGSRCCGCGRARGPTGSDREVWASPGRGDVRRGAGQRPDRAAARRARASSAGRGSCPARGWCSARCSCRRPGSRWCSSPTTRRRVATRSSPSSRTTTSTCARSCGRETRWCCGPR